MKQFINTQNPPSALEDTRVNRKIKIKKKPQRKKLIKRRRKSTGRTLKISFNNKRVLKKDSNNSNYLISLQRINSGEFKTKDLDILSEYFQKPKKNISNDPTKLASFNSKNTNSHNLDIIAPDHQILKISDWENTIVGVRTPMLEKEP